ncbi:MAG TPA: YicC/YloC family endoribonuclease [Oscillospiraceae bacterium]|nr:YicC/YloC family endoribonuclease [Oscillospiraceae bacterium]
MIKSMTGFGSFKGSIDGFTVSVELRSVNHRFFEFSVRIPKNYSSFEDRIRKNVSSKIERGKVDCFIQLELPEGEEIDVQANHALAEKYLNAANSVAESLGIRKITSFSELMRYPDIITPSPVLMDEERVWSVIETALNDAVSKIVKMREHEGAHLKDDIVYRVGLIKSEVDFVNGRSPETAAQYNEKLLARMKTAIGDIPVDEQRLLTEAAIYADKVAVDEETVRLCSHLEQLLSTLSAKGPVGRKLDFLVQEINREANTIGSKAQDVDITRSVIEIKSQAEKIREQIQNIE